MTIAITGATGFLGLRLLPLLMQRAPVVVLAHAGSAPPHDRIVRHLRATGLPSEAAANLTVLHTDLTKPRMGLPQWHFLALAQRLSEIWHCAGSIDLTGRAEQLWPVNVTGTRSVLELASAGTAIPFHMSSAFVAGRRRTGVIGEGDLDGSRGFENPYEESKFYAEREVHDWSRRNHRPAVIFRPSVLITDRPPRPGEAPHPVLTALRISDYINSSRASDALAGGRHLVRIAADPDAHLNLIPVELAARLMVGLSDLVQPSGVHTAHVTYPCEVTIATMLSLFERRYPLKLVPTHELPEHMTALESLAATHMSGFAPYCFHQRYYDRATLRAAGLDPAAAPPLDLDYLLRGM